ncbi:hypothetical protein TNCV_1769611 [Trichonephila clavipes]|nr:hypothetical protein TNCV_1769611 [Trichonephila clavipes]
MEMKPSKNNKEVLTKLTKGKNLSGRMIRWVLKLSKFNIEWEHWPGSQNVVANAISRKPGDNVEGSQISCAVLRALALNSREQLIQEQREDPELGHIYRYLENPDDGSVYATVCEGWSNSKKSRRSRKPSGIENKSCKSDKGNAGLEDLRVKRSKAVESTAGMKKRMETARQNLQPEQLWKLKQEPALITDPNSDVGKCI